MQRRGTTLYVVVLGVLLVGAVLCLVASGMSWGAAQRADLVSTEVEVSGGDLVPIGRAAGLLGLAAVVAVHATRRWGRRLVGVLLAVTGVAVAGQAFLTGRDLADRILSHLEGPAGAGEYTGVGTVLGGPLLMTAGGAAVTASGVAIAVWGPRWPSMGARYERKAASRPANESGERAAWDALDRGEDPTA